MKDNKFSNLLFMRNIIAISLAFMGQPASNRQVFPQRNTLIHLLPRKAENKTDLPFLIQHSINKHQINMKCFKSINNKMFYYSK